MSIEPITIVRGLAAPLMRANIDTDAIIPSREMTTVGKAGLGRRLFANWRFKDGPVESRAERSEFVLNRAPYRNARILLAGENFGCGSSREGAAWALYDFGIRVVIAPSFGAIFRANCIRNGLLPVVLDVATVEDIARQMDAGNGESAIEVDLQKCLVTDASGIGHPFTLPPMQREMLIEGLDSIDLAMRRVGDIDAFHDALAEGRPWLFGVREEGA